MIQKELLGQSVILRQLDHDYFDAYLKMFSPKIQKILHVSSINAELEYLEDRLEKMEQGLTLFYCIFDVKTNTLIGAIEIRNEQESSGQLYIWLNEKYWGTGLYQEAVRLASQEYFNYSHRLFLNAHVDIINKRSYHALKKCGFAESGFFNGPYGKQYDLVLRKKN